MAPAPEMKRSTTGGTDPRLGIALGSGSARGWAHIGVLQALAELGIRPGIVSGSSIGALVGAAYASRQLDAFEEWVRSLSWKQIIGYLDLSLRGGGLIQGENLLAFVHRQMQEREIESLPLTFGAVATDLGNGREVWFREGSLLDAVRASIALPGLFTPVKLQGRWLVDGGLVDPVPISLCRAMGAERVIAVNLNGDIVGKHFQSRTSPNSPPNPPLDEETLLWQRMSQQIRNSLNERKDQLLTRLLGEERNAPGLLEVMSGSINIMQDRITRSRMAGDPPEILLAPRLARIGLMEFDQAALAIAEGRACIHRMGPALEPLLED